jgi:hypothetical protein
MPGRPARFTVTVKMSFRYIASGSSDFSPSANGADGAWASAGVDLLPGLSKSSAMRRRTFSAFR